MGNCSPAVACTHGLGLFIVWGAGCRACSPEGSSFTPHPLKRDHTQEKNPLFANKATTSAFLHMKMCLHAVWSSPQFAT